MPFNPVERETLSLEAGETFVLFSDGVSEARDVAGGFYSEERLQATLSGAGSDTPQEIVTRVLADVRAFAAGAEQSDDITILAARFSPHV